MAVRKTAFFVEVLFLILFITVGSSPSVYGADETKKSSERRKKEELEAMEAAVLAQEKKWGGKGKIVAEEGDNAFSEWKNLQKEFLFVPKKRRIRFMGDFNMTYDTNVERRPLGGEKDHEEGDTVFRLNPIVQLNLGGKRTDLQTEFRAAHQYSVKRPQIDTSDFEGTLRFGRRTKQIGIALNQRLNQNMIRVVGMDDKRVRWDISHHGSVNYGLGRKLSTNVETEYSRQEFPHDSLEENTTYTFGLNSNLFYQMTPKTRFSGGYRWAFTRIRPKVSDNTVHQFRLGYFGKITGKSSASLDVGINVQTPDSADATRSRQLQWSLGYIWQVSPKTSFRALYSNSIQRSVTDSLEIEKLIKNTSHTVSDTLSLSLRFRLHRKMGAQISFDGTHGRSHSSVDEVSDSSKSRTFAFPAQLAIDYDLATWIRLRFTYTFRYQLGNELADEHRAHTWFIGSNLVF